MKNCVINFWNKLLFNSGGKKSVAFLMLLSIILSYGIIFILIYFFPKLLLFFIFIIITRLLYKKLKNIKMQEEEYEKFKNDTNYKKVIISCIKFLFKTNVEMPLIIKKIFFIISLIITILNIIWIILKLMKFI